jgi:hypothetical protein
MDPMLFPDEALGLLREARHDPEAERGFNKASGAFLWSDELLHRARPLCAKGGSHAELYLLRYRRSLICGEPIEEYRRPWDQLRAACPDWPGFRPERSTTALARGQERERRLQALLPGPCPAIVAFLIGLCLLPLVFALPIGVNVTAFSLERDSLSGNFWIGIGLQLAGIVFWEVVIRAWVPFCRVGTKWAAPNDGQPGFFETVVLLKLWLFELQMMTVMVLGLLLDGGVHLRACCYVYSLYAILALGIVAVRRKSKSRVEVFFVRWGWAPMLAFGMPLLLPRFIAAGWISIIS